MASKKILVVFGATGAQGGSVVKSVLGDAKMRETWTVRGVTRDVSKPSAKALEELGAETVAVRLLDLKARPLTDLLAGRSERLRCRESGYERSLWGLWSYKLLGES